MLDATQPVQRPPAPPLLVLLPAQGRIEVRQGRRRLPTEGPGVTAVGVGILALEGIRGALGQADGLLGGGQSSPQTACHQEQVCEVLVADRGVLPAGLVEPQGDVALVAASSPQQAAAWPERARSASRPLRKPSRTAGWTAQVVSSTPENTVGTA